MAKTTIDVPLSDGWTYTAEQHAEKPYRMHEACIHVFRYGSLSSSGTGKGVTVYVVDSGVRLTHQEFVSDLTGQRRASFG